MKLTGILMTVGLVSGAVAVDIVREGRPAAVIAVAPEASEADLYAAGELQKYLRLMTGAELPVTQDAPAGSGVIKIGAAAGLDGWQAVDEVAIVTPDPETLLLAGEGTRGALYSVYVLLEELGARFFAADCEVLPAGKDLALDGIDYRYAPPFAYREPHSELIFNDDLMAKWRVNGGMFKHRLPDEMGGFYQMDMSHSLINEFLKPSEHFAAHPEWYAWRSEAKERKPTQVCVSNPEALAQLIREVRAKLAADPSLGFIAIGGQDNNEYCQCGECAAAVKEYGTNAAPYLLALNRVAREIAADYPGVKVMFQAYWGTERPPEKMTLEPNVAVTLAMLDRNHGFPAAKTPRHNEYLGRWSALTGGEVYIWDYWATFGNFLLPMPNLDAIGETMRTYLDFGVKGVFNQLPFGTLADFGELRNYLFARLAWNPRLDVPAMIDEFCRAYYRAAAPQVLQYIAVLQKARDRQPNTWIGVYSEETKHWLLPQDVARCLDLFATASAAVRDDSEAAFRLRRLSAGLLLVQCLRYDELAAAGVAMKPRAELIDELAELGREAGCGAYKEWDDFSNLIQRLRESASTQPLAAGGGEVTAVPEQPLLAFRPQDHGYPWMPFGEHAVVYTVPAGQAGIWQVAITLRVHSQDLSNPAAAYAGVYALNEAARAPVPASAGSGLVTLDLGCRMLPEGSQIWAMPGVIGPIEAIEVASITLTPPAS